jgi:hypothetical protein
MNELLNEWEKYCEGELDTEDSHFLGLFKSGVTEQEVKRALRYFPGSDQIERRIWRVLRAGYLGEYMYLQRPRMVHIDRATVLARSWLDEQARFCAELGLSELQQLASTASILFVDEAEFERKRVDDNPGGWIHDHMADEVFMPLIGAPRTTFALIEAAYGVAADSLLAWYITQPVLKTNLDFSKYFDFWSSGGAGVLTEEAFLVRKDADS